VFNFVHLNVQVNAKTWPVIPYLARVLLNFIGLLSCLTSFSYIFFCMPAAVILNAKLTWRNSVTLFEKNKMQVFIKSFLYSVPQLSQTEGKGASWLY